METNDENLHPNETTFSTASTDTSVIHEKDANSFEKNLIYKHHKFIKNTFSRQSNCYTLTYKCCKFRKTKSNPAGCFCGITMKHFFDGTETLTKTRYAHAFYIVSIL